MRPNTLKEVAQLTLHGESFDVCLMEFLDEFYLKPSQDALAGEPEMLREALPGKGLVYDAYLAATAEALACKYGLDTPSWAYGPNRKLHHPWFALTLASLRAVLLVESPPAFRSRNLFVSENALSRA
jgi:hypothetical protein